MLDDKQLEQEVQNLILDICEVLYRRGYETVPVGAMMRLVGVPEERAQSHDQEMFALDEDFETMLATRRAGSKKSRKHTKVPATNTPTLH